jgi:hypothetical protein
LISNTDNIFLKKLGQADDLQQLNSQDISGRIGVRNETDHIQTDITDTYIVGQMCRILISIPRTYKKIQL